jgi:hypothetical protein
MREPWLSFALAQTSLYKQRRTSADPRTRGPVSTPRAHMLGNTTHTSRPFRATHTAVVVTSAASMTRLDRASTHSWRTPVILLAGLGARATRHMHVTARADTHCATLIAHRTVRVGSNIPLEPLGDYIRLGECSRLAQYGLGRTRCERRDRKSVPETHNENRRAKNDGGRSRQTQRGVHR